MKPQKINLIKNNTVFVILFSVLVVAGLIINVISPFQSTWTLMLLPFLLLVSRYPYWRVGIIAFLVLAFLHVAFEMDPTIEPIEVRRMIIGILINSVLCMVITFGSVRYHRLFENLYILSVTDSLTSVYNRRQFDICIEDFIKTKKPKEELCLAVFDIDHFKHVNDTYGHPFGDVILTEFTEVIKENIRPTDHLFRIGGEEFALLLTNTNKTTAKQVAEKIRDEAKKQTFMSPTGQSVQITVSGGVVGYKKESTKAFYEKADKRLYQAKKSGRDAIY